MKSFEFFNTLQKESQEELLASSTFMKIPEGMQLYSQGDICTDILFLTKGRVRVWNDPYNLDTF